MLGTHDCPRVADTLWMGRQGALVKFPKAGLGTTPKIVDFFQTRWWLGGTLRLNLKPMGASTVDPGLAR